MLNMAAFSGVIKEIQSFRHGEEGTVKRHRSPPTVNFVEQRNIFKFAVDLDNSTRHFVVVSKIL